MYLVRVHFPVTLPELSHYKASKFQGTYQIYRLFISKPMIPQRYTMDLQSLDAAYIYIICENFCLHCHEGHGDHQAFPSVSAAQDANAKALRYTLVSLSTVCKSWGYIAQKTLHHHFDFSEVMPQVEVLFCRTISETQN